MHKERKYNAKYLKKADGTRGYDLTDAGMDKVVEHASQGGTIRELAKLFGVGASTISHWHDEEHPNFKPQFAEAWEQGQYNFTATLRESQLELGRVNASMAIHLGKHYLEQNDKPMEHHHLHRVIGTMPDYEQTPEQWAANFAPEPVLEHHKHIEMEVDDAEIVERESETGQKR